MSVTSAKAFAERVRVKERSRVEQYERIRRDSRDQGLSVRALAARYGVHRRTVRAALGDATPAVRKVPVRDRPVLGAFQDVVRDWLIKDKGEPRKQRHTARRVWERLTEEGPELLAVAPAARWSADLGRMNLLGPWTPSSGPRGDVWGVRLGNPPRTPADRTGKCRFPSSPAQ
jgi:hypothetical protein